MLRRRSPRLLGSRPIRDKTAFNFDEKADGKIDLLKVSVGGRDADNHPNRQAGRRAAHDLFKSRGHGVAVLGHQLRTRRLVDGSAGRPGRKKTGDPIRDRADLLIDAHGAYTAESALFVGRKLQDLGVYWLEDPLAPEDVDGYIHLTAALDMAVAAGETECTRWQFEERLQTRPSQP